MSYFCYNFIVIIIIKDMIRLYKMKELSTGRLLTRHVSLAGKFTDIPTNITAREGQNIEMACAFQSGLSSVYLEIQWWFIRAPEELITSEEDEDDTEVITCYARVKQGLIIHNVIPSLQKKSLAHCMNARCIWRT